jgi:hypothetical protein
VSTSGIDSFHRALLTIQLCNSIIEPICFVKSPPAFYYMLPPDHVELSDCISKTFAAAANDDDEDELRLHSSAFLFHRDLCALGAFAWNLCAEYPENAHYNECK